MTSLPKPMSRQVTKSMRDSFRGTLAKDNTRCAHCGRQMNNFAGGSSKVGGNNTCHPNAKDRPDCYRLVTVYKHEMPCTHKSCYEDGKTFIEYVQAAEPPGYDWVDDKLLRIVDIDRYTKKIGIDVTLHIPIPLEESVGEKTKTVKTKTPRKKKVTEENANL